MVPITKGKDMNFLKRMFGGAEATVNRVSGRTDLLEAMCAGAALAAAADGNIDDKEIDDAVKICQNNEVIGKAFTLVAIENCVQKQIARANGGFSGRNALWKEIGDVAKDPDDALAVYLIVLDVVHSDGKVEASEQAVLDKMATVMHIDPKKVLAA